LSAISHARSLDSFVHDRVDHLCGDWFFGRGLAFHRLNSRGACARSSRLTQRRLEAMTPLSMAEINAVKNPLRAQFARSTRRLEVRVERISAQVIGQLATLAKKGEAVVRLRLELGKTAAAALAAEARREAAADQLASAKRELAAGSWSLQAAERSLADTSATLVKVASDLCESAMMASCRRIELVVLRSRHEVLKGQVEHHEQEISALRRRIEGETAISAVADHQLTEERSKAAALGARMAELKRHLVVQRSGKTRICIRHARARDRARGRDPGDFRAGGTKCGGARKPRTIAASRDVPQSFGGRGLEQNWPIARPRSPGKETCRKRGENECLVGAAPLGRPIGTLRAPTRGAPAHRGSAGQHFKIAPARRYPSLPEFSWDSL
jgi:hypothetical protein